jgi:hypothetical protein
VTDDNLRTPAAGEPIEDRTYPFLVARVGIVVWQIWGQNVITASPQSTGERLPA